MNIIKSIGAVIAGILFVVVTHTLTDFILESLGVFPPPDQGLFITWMVVTALVYRIIFTVVGSCLTAKLAPSRPMLHSIILGVVGTVMGTMAAVAAIPINLSPAWYPIALAATALPAAWLGGWLATRGRISSFTTT